MSISRMSMQAGTSRFGEQVGFQPLATFGEQVGFQPLATFGEQLFQPLTPKSESYLGEFLYWMLAA
jgi:hypothetical protein